MHPASSFDARSEPKRSRQYVEDFTAATFRQQTPEFHRKHNADKKKVSTRIPCERYTRNSSDQQQSIQTKSVQTKINR